MKSGHRVLPPRYGRRLLRASCLTTVSIVQAARYHHYDCCALACAVFLCSVNYWRDPRMGSWRRSVDIFAAVTAILYQCWKALTSAPPWTRIIYCLCIFLATCCYCMALYHGRQRQDYNASSAWHVGIHVIGNVGNLLLYQNL